MQVEFMRRIQLQDEGNRRTNVSSSNSSNMVRIRYLKCTLRPLLPQNSEHILGFMKAV